MDDSGKGCHIPGRTKIRDSAVIYAHASKSPRTVPGCASLSNGPAEFRQLNQTVSVWSDFLAGCLGGTAGLFVGYPFDTIKVRQQTSVIIGTQPSIAITATEAFVRDGPRIFYRGMAFPLISEGFRNSLFFGIYGSLLEIQVQTAASFRDSSKRTRQVGVPEPTYTQVAVAGGIAGGIQGVAATPIELVKVILQSNNGRSSVTYTGPTDCLRRLHASYGVTALFRGLNITVLREVPALATYMVTYEFIKRTLSGPMDDQFRPAPSLAAELFAGGMAGVMSWTINMPVDVIKTRIQSDCPARPRYDGIVDCCIKSYREEGIRIFWRGLTVTCLRAFPCNAITLVVYSNSLRLLRQREQHSGIQPVER